MAKFSTFPSKARRFRGGWLNETVRVLGERIDDLTKRCVCVCVLEEGGEERIVILGRRIRERLELGEWQLVA